MTMNPARSNCGSISVPGRRVYFGKDGERLIICWAAARKRQRRDIAAAIAKWKDYRGRGTATPLTRDRAK